MKMSIVAAIFVSLVAFSCAQPESAENLHKNNNLHESEFSATREIPAEDNTSAKEDANNSSNLPDNTKFVLSTPPNYIKPIEIGEISVYGYYIPTQKFTEDKLPYALVLSNLDYNKIAWGLYKVSADDTHEKLGVGYITVDEKVGGIFIEERKFPDENTDETTEFIGLELYPAEFRKNELFIKKSVKSEGKTIFNELLEQYEELHFIRIADLDVKPTAVLFGNFHPAKANGSANKDVLLRIWTNGVWTLTANPRYYTKENKSKLEKLDGAYNPRINSTEKIAISGTWTAENSKIRFVRTVKSTLDEIEADFVNNPPTEEYEFVFNTHNFVLWLTTTKISGALRVGITAKSELHEVTVLLPAN